MLTWQLHLGSAFDVLRRLPEGSVSACVTSPPFYGLRDYKVPPIVVGGDDACDHQWRSQGRKAVFPQSNLNRLADEYSPRPQPRKPMRQQTEDYRISTNAGEACERCGAFRGALGLEPSPELYVQHMVTLFREVRRVLHPRGALLLNLGDSWCNDAKGPRGTERSTLADRGAYQTDATPPRQQKGYRGSAWRLKRKDLMGIPWTVALALRFDGWWLRDEIIWWKQNPMPSPVKDRTVRAHEHVFLLTKSAKYYFDHEAIAEPVSPESIPQLAAEYDGVDTKDYDTAGVQRPGSIKARIVAKMRRSGNKVRRYGEAVGRPDSHGQHLGRSVPWAGLTRSARSVWPIRPQPSPYEHFAVMPSLLAQRCVRAACESGGTVLDPFAGAGTTGVVSLGEGRNFIGIELSEKYHAIARRRLAEVAPLLAQEVAS